MPKQDDGVYVLPEQHEGINKLLADQEREVRGYALERMSYELLAVTVHYRTWTRQEGNQATRVFILGKDGDVLEERDG